MSRTMRKFERWTGMTRGIAAAVVMLGTASLLTGCDNFFVPVKSTGGGGTGGTTVGGSGANYAYILNRTTNTVSGFLIGAGTLVPTPSSPYALAFVPQGGVVARANNFLYLAGPSAIYALPISWDGSLAGSAQAVSVAIASELVLAVSRDGQWLFGLNSQSTTLDEWKINQSTGVLSAMPSAPFTLTNAVSSPMMLLVSPTSNYVFAALGSGGDHVFTLNTTTGAIASTQHLYLGSDKTGDNSLATDSTGSTLYIARSGVNGGLAVYTIGTTGVLSPVSGSPFATGLGTFDVAVDASDKYVYAANRSDGTISAFSIGTSSALTALSGSPFASGKLVTSLVPDRSGKYLLAAAAGGSPDLTLYSFDATVAGKLDTAATAASGTDPAGSTLVMLAH